MYNTLTSTSGYIDIFFYQCLNVHDVLVRVFKMTVAFARKRVPCLCFNLKLCDWKVEEGPDEYWVVLRCSSHYVLSTLSSVTRAIGHSLSASNNRIMVVNRIFCAVTLTVTCREQLSLLHGFSSRRHQDNYMSVGFATDTFFSKKYTVDFIHLTLLCLR